MDNIDNITSLLNQIGTIREKNAEILEASGGMFNVFQESVRHRENPNSDFIAALLNPQGSHGLKHKFLECFIETLANINGNSFEINGFSLDLKKINCERVNVKTEHSIEGGRLDILITDQNKTIIIENKINSGDGEEQLTKYDKYAKSEYKEGNYQILYLTLDGRDAPEHSAGEVDYVPISYKDTIIGWLEKCLPFTFAVRHNNVRNAIIQYINYLKILTNQDMDTKHKEKIVDMIVDNPSFFKNAEYIQGIWNDCKKCFGKKIGDIIKDTIEKFGLERDYDYNNIGYDDFNAGGGVFALFHKNNWCFHLFIAYTPGFETNSELFIGLSRDGALEEGREDVDATISKLHELFSHLSCYNADDCIVKTNPLKPIWSKTQDEISKYVFEEIKNIDDILKNNGF